MGEAEGGASRKGKSAAGRSTSKVGRYKTAEESGRYTPPIPKSVKRSPAWFGAVVLALLIGGVPACSYGRSEATFAKSASASMPFQFFRDTRIVLPIEVNGHPVEALLDSGYYRRK